MMTPGDLSLPPMQYMKIRPLLIPSSIKSKVSRIFDSKSFSSGTNCLYLKSCSNSFNWSYLVTFSTWVILRLLREALLQAVFQEPMKIGGKNDGLDDLKSKLKAADSQKKIIEEPKKEETKLKKKPDPTQTKTLLKDLTSKSKRIKSAVARKITLKTLMPYAQNKQQR